MRPPATGSPPGSGEAHVAAGSGKADQAIYNTASLPHSDSPFATRRRFLILAAMAGWVQPERVTERILQELADEVQP
jgi:hypothetical protein